jgi:Protein of unknown function (DUF3987)
MTAPAKIPLFDKYFSYVDKTEPPLIFHRWCLLTSLGAYLGRQYKFQFGDFNIYPNMYVMLMGDPGTRKSTAVKLSRRVLSQAGYDKFAAERTSKEKFLLDLEGVEGDDGLVKDTNSVMRNLLGDSFEGSDPKEVFVCADEFNEFVGSANLEFLSLLGSLWDWDDDAAPFRQRLKTSRSVSIYQPTISILSGNTHAGFAEAFPPQAMGQGFLSRLLLIHGESSGKKIAFPERPSDELKAELAGMFSAIRHKVVGIATMTEQAKGMLTTIYNTFPGLEDARFKHYSTRRFTHLLKLCMLISACNLRTEIRAEDVLFANTLLTFTEHKMPMALGEFGKAKNSDVAAKVMSVLAEARAPLDLPDIWRQVQTDLDRPEDLNKLLAGLMQGGKINHINGKATGGATGFVITRKLLSNRHVYVDFDLLKEARV